MSLFKLNADGVRFCIGIGISLENMLEVGALGEEGSGDDTDLAEFVSIGLLRGDAPL